MPQQEQEADTLQIATKYLIPKNNFWLKRFSVLFAFIMLDYFVTLRLITEPNQEANLLARDFMQSYGIPLGLTIFALIGIVFIYFLFCLNSHFATLPPRLSGKVEGSADLGFAWFIAGLHFNGAASWVWFAPDILRQSLGASIYLLIICFCENLVRVRSDKLYTNPLIRSLALKCIVYGEKAYGKL